MPITGPPTVTVPCLHCGLEVRVTGKTEEARQRQAFCCGGCVLAHHFAADGVTRSADRLLARVLLSAMLSMGVMMLSLSLYGRMLGEQGDFQSESAQAFEGLKRLAAMGISAPVLLLLGLPLLESVLRTRRWLSADALVVAGVTSAWMVSAWSTLVSDGEVYFDTATMVLVLVGLGRWMDLRAKDRARGELRGLLPEREPSAQLLRGDEECEVSADEIREGDLLRLRPGESLLVDGIVERGRSFLDVSDLAGEEQPRVAEVGSSVLAGHRLVDGSLDVRVTATGGDRVCAEIERILEEALRRPPESVRVADRVAAHLMPIVLLLAVATALWHWNTRGPEHALLAALSVVLVACPCSLGIATPLAFWVALGRAWKLGILVRGADVLERLAGAKRVLFDKTGTLTDGCFALKEVRSLGEASRAEVLRVAAHLELGSEHPIGRGLVAAWRREHPAEELDADLVTAFRALPGRGVEARFEGAHWMLQAGETEGGIQLQRDGVAVAQFQLEASMRPESKSVVEALRQEGFELEVLTGDGAVAAERLARALSIEVRAECLPADKVAALHTGDANRTVFVGDGLNDAAVLASAGVGISMAGGSARSLDVSPVNFLRPGLAQLPALIALAQAARRTARWNLFWAFGYNAVALSLAVSGSLPPILAAAAMVVSSAVVVLNSSRLKHAHLSSTEAIPGVLRKSPEVSIGRPASAEVSGAL